MTGKIELVVTIGEDGSDGRRIDRLTAELRDLLDAEPGCTARHAERLSDRASPKGAVEMVPGAIAVALAAGLMGLALAFWYIWLVVIAAIALLVTIGGLLFEYYVGQNAQQLTDASDLAGSGRSAAPSLASRTVVFTMEVG